MNTPFLFKPEPIRLPQLLFVHTRSVGPGPNNDNTNPQKRLQQISWSIADDYGKTWSVCNHYLGDDNSGIPKRNDALAYYLQSPIEDNGQLATVLFALYLDLYRADMIIAHNLEYHLQAITREVTRLSLIIPSSFMPDNIQYVDLRVASAEFCNLDGKSSSPKYPTLAELYKCCVDKEYVSENDTLKDLEVSKSCYYFLKRKGCIR